MSDSPRFDPERFGGEFHEFLRWTQEFAGAGERSEVSLLIEEFLGPEASEQSVYDPPPWGYAAIVCR